MSPTLISIDNKLETFARKIGAVFNKDNSKGSHIDGYEQRTIAWEKDNLHFVIQIFPSIEKNRITKWVLWICCSTMAENRQVVDRTLIEARKKDLIIVKIDDLLEEAYSLLQLASQT